jgi:hypothetical protein
VYYLFITTKEGNSNTPPETIYGSENAYTNINCINESLPVFKINPSGLFCLSSTANEQNCYKYSDFNVPTDYTCTNSRKDLNNYLSKDGLRDIKSTSRQIFNNLSQQGYYNHGCSQSNYQKSDLEQQVQVLNEAFPQAKVFQDIGSGLNFKRQGFVSLLQRIYKGDVEQVVVTYKDRLCRFGFELFEWILKQHNTKLLVLNESFDTNQSVSNELAEDLIAVTNYFVARNNGLRSAKYKKARKQNNQIQVDEEPNKEMQATS